jgi:flavin reductase (DIM6/NTAB) family NADH-FMN oxidoreductase RutF
MQFNLVWWLLPPQAWNEFIGVVDWTPFQCGEMLMSDAPGMIDVKQFWQAIGQRATGSTIVTARSENGPAGLLGLSATHLCADPPTMLVSVDKRTSALATILDAGHFAINYLPSAQRELADMFGGKSNVKGADRFTTASWTTLATGAPVLRDAVGAIDCELIETIERYNVVMILGRVVATSGDPQAVPLVHFRGGYLS